MTTDLLILEMYILAMDRYISHLVHQASIVVLHSDMDIKIGIVILIIRMLGDEMMVLLMLCSDHVLYDTMYHQTESGKMY